MNTKKGLSITVGLSILVFVVVSVGTAVVLGRSSSDQAFAGDETPPRPPWVNEDGTIDLDKAPTRMPIAGSDGQTLGWIQPNWDPPSWGPTNVNDPQPGDPGYEARKIPVTNEAGDVILGYLEPDGSVGIGHSVFKPIELETEPGPVGPVGTTDEGGGVGVTDESGPPVGPVSFPE